MTRTQLIIAVIKGASTELLQYAPSRVRVYGAPKELDAKLRCKRIALCKSNAQKRAYASNRYMVTV